MRIAIIGRSEIMFETLELCLKQGHEVPLIITAKETPEYLKTAADFENIAKRIGADFIFTSKLNNDEIIERIKNANCNIALSINFSGIISQNVIDLFEHGVLNAHGGDLPRYRGNACQAWAIINGEEKIGLCIYKMLGGYLDGGKIITRLYLPININSTVTETWNWFYKEIPKSFLHSANILVNEPDFFIEDTLKSSVKPLRCYPRNSDDGKIDWNKSNLEIIRLINASCEPYAGAFCHYKDEKMIIWAAELQNDEEEYVAIAGQIALIREGFVDVITGGGKIRINEIEIHGQRVKPNLIIKSIRDRLK